MVESYAEQSVIGTLLTSSGNAMDDIPAELDASMFQDNFYASVYAIFQGAHDKGETVGVALIKQKLSMREEFPQDFIDKKLKDSLQNGFSSETVGADAKEIITAYKSRALNEVLNRTVITPDNLSQAVDYLTMEIDRLGNRSSKREKSLPQIVEENKDNYFCDRKKDQVDIEFSTLNDMLGGFECGDMIVIGARPAVGKSAFATQLTRHFAEKGEKIAYFNLEMTEKQTYERFVSTESGIGITRIKRAIGFTGDERERFESANRRLSEKSNIVIITGTQTVTSIRNTIKNKGYTVAVIDYLQLIKAEGRYKGNRFAEVGEISHSLKGIATDFGIPVIVLSQLNRASVGREDKEPTMSELRESGDIEQDASVILLLWNLDEEKRNKGCKIEKNRQGKTGKVEMRFNGDLMRFEELTDTDGFVPMETPFDT